MAATSTAERRRIHASYTLPKPRAHLRELLTERSRVNRLTLTRAASR
jgi:hypothetical protein